MKFGIELLTALNQLSQFPSDTQNTHTDILQVVILYKSNIPGKGTQNLKFLEFFKAEHETSPLNLTYLPRKKQNAPQDAFIEKER